MRDDGKRRARGTDLGRRAFVMAAIGGAAASALGVSCGGGGDDDDGAGGNGGSGGTGGTGGATCTVYPEQTEGPYYVDVNLIRSDITEGAEGTPLTVTLEVLTESDCDPIAGATVEIWQANAGGVYSGIADQGTTGQTFLRGAQVTGSNGRATFQTVYPGWYQGRTTHIHFKVHVTGRTATSQLYFPDDVTEAVYGEGVYEIRGQKDTSNGADGTRSSAPLAAVTSSNGGYAAALTVTVAGT